MKLGGPEQKRGEPKEAAMAEVRARAFVEALSARHSVGVGELEGAAMGEDKGARGGGEDQSMSGGSVGFERVRGWERRLRARGGPARGVSGWRWSSGGLVAGGAARGQSGNRGAGGGERSGEAGQAAWLLRAVWRCSGWGGVGRRLGRERGARESAVGGTCAWCGGWSARAFGLFGLLGPVYSVFKKFGHLEMLPILHSVFPVFLYSVFGLFGSVFGHDHIDQKEEMAAQIYKFRSTRR